MPPRLYSRHTFTVAMQDEDELLFLSAREPFRYEPLADTRTHIAKGGESLFTLAARYFSSFQRPAGLWWVIADFQSTPIFDPTVTLAPGEVILIPAERVIIERIFSEERRLKESV